MNEVSVYCPASISFLFQAHFTSNPITTGSLGIGCTVNSGIRLKVASGNKYSMIFNKKHISFPLIDSLVKQVSPKPVSITVRSALPLGSGFGLSGACALSCLLAINKLYNLRIERDELVKIAHTAEIKHRTGLGTIATQSMGGFLVKTHAGLPVHAYQLPFVGKRIYAIIISRLPTNTILTDSRQLKCINQEAKKALQQINRQSTLEEILDISYHYATKANLITNKTVRNMIQDIYRSGGHATMAMLGHVVISDQKPTITYNYPMKGLTITKDSAIIL